MRNRKAAVANSIDPYMKPSNPKAGKAKWIEIGYKHLAEHGPKKLSSIKISFGPKAVCQEIPVKSM